jgi:hypothetical protein
MELLVYGIGSERQTATFLGTAGTVMQSSIRWRHPE